MKEVNEKIIEEINSLKDENNKLNEENYIFIFLYWSNSLIIIKYNIKEQNNILNDENNIMKEQKEQSIKDNNSSNQANLKLIQEKVSINNQLNLIYQIFIYIQFFIININQRRKK